MIRHNGDKTLCVVVDGDTILAAHSLQEPFTDMIGPQYEKTTGHKVKVFKYPMDVLVDLVQNTVDEQRREEDARWLAGLEGTL